MRGLPTSGAARLAAGFTGFLLVASVPVALAADSSGRADALRATGASLAAQADAATRELHALEAQLSRARADTERLRARQRAVAADRAATRQRLTIARRVLAISQQRLAELVRALYQQPEHGDPLAIVLGAASLDEALSGLETLQRAAGENKRIVAQARTARTRLAGVEARLAARAAELDRLADAADAHAAALRQAAAARAGLLAGLRHRAGLNAARLAAVEAQEQMANARTIAVATVASIPAPAAPAEPVPEPVQPAAQPARSGDTLTVLATGYAIKGRTATGVTTGPGIVAVDPSVIPLGSRLSIPGYGDGIAADTGGAVQGHVIDVWFPTLEQALAWGRRTVTITVK